MGTTIELDDEMSPDPLEELKQLLKGWEVTYEEGKFICSREGIVYHTSEVYIEPVYRSNLLAIAFAARKEYGSRW